MYKIFVGNTGEMRSLGMYRHREEPRILGLNHKIENSSNIKDRIDVLNFSNIKLDIGR
jgi:hypothetical protein